MEQLKVLDPKPLEHLDSLASLLYTLQSTALRITLHTMAAACLVVRLHALPFIFAYKTCAKRVTPVFRLIERTLTSPACAIRNLYHLYHIVSSKPEIVELPEIRKPSIEDAISVKSILLKRLGIQEYHDTLQEVRRSDSQHSPVSPPRAAFEFADEARQSLTVSCKLDVEPNLPAPVDDPQERNSCAECVHDRLGCVTCTRTSRKSSVDSDIPRRSKSDGEFRPLPPINDESLKLAWRQVQAKKSGKLQKRLAR